MSTDIRLNESQVCDAWNIYFKLPIISLAQNAFNGYTLQSDPVVELKSIRQVNSDILTYLINEYYKPYCMEQRKWWKVIGVHPFYFEKIRGTDDYIPRTPSVGSGYITVACSRNNVPTYQWTWCDTGGVDSKVYFNVGPNPPLLDGTLISPIASLINDWKTISIVRESTELVTYQQSHQQHIFEHHPARNVVGDDNLTTLEEFGDTVAQSVIRQQEGLSTMKFKVRTDALYDAMNDAASRNYGTKRKYGRNSFINSEGLSDTWERQNSSLVERGIPLKQDFYYKSVPQSSVTADFKHLCSRMDYMSAFVMDFPLQLIENTGAKAASNSKSNSDFLQGRIKDWTRIYEESIKRIIIMIYGKDIGNILNVRGQIDAVLNIEISVYIPIQPNATLEDLKSLYEQEIIDPKTFATHAFKLLNLPIEEIHVEKKKKKDVD
jgi:hypothetical protein